MNEKASTSSSGDVFVDHHTFWLVEPEFFPSDPVGQTNGLVTTQPGVAVIFTGIAMGPVAVTIEIYDDSLPPAETSTWDEVVEVTLEAPGGEVSITGPQDEGPEELGIVTPAGPGFYRLRVHARGRDARFDGSVRQPVESYVLQVCPGEAGEEIIYKHSDRCGEIFRAEQ